MANVVGLDLSSRPKGPGVGEKVHSFDALALAFLGKLFEDFDHIIVIQNLLYFFGFVDQVVPDRKEKFIFFVDVFELIDSIPLEVSLDVTHFVLAVFFFAGGPYFCEDVVGVVEGGLPFPSLFVGELGEDAIEDVCHSVEMIPHKKKILGFCLHKVVISG